MYGKRPAWSRQTSAPRMVVELEGAMSLRPTSGCRPAEGRFGTSSVRHGERFPKTHFPAYHTRSGLVCSGVMPVAGDRPPRSSLTPKK